jgi:23S rRNA (uracil1939-C5)-methyltransferase
VEVRCRDLDERGAAVGEAEGREVHVAGALPGELVRAVIEHLSPHGPQAWGRLVAVLAPSPQRVAPVCPAYGSCGGCPLQHFAYPGQVAWKTDLVRAAASRQVALQGVAVAGCVPSPRPLGYRNQGKYVYGRDQSGALVLGAYAPRSHLVVDLAGCRVVEPVIDQVAARLLPLLASHRAQPFEEKDRRGDLRYVVIRANAEEEVLVCLVAGRPAWDPTPLAAALKAEEPRVVGVVLNVNDSPGNALYGPQEVVLAGSPTLRERIGEVEVELSARSFFQVNREIARRAYEDLRAAAVGLQPIRRAVDAYAGAGGIAFALAPLAEEVVAIEENAAAAETAARFAASRAPNVCFVTGDAAHHLAAVGSADLVVLNPPRAGCSPEVLAATAALQPRLVAYLSCHLATLTRDIAVLRQRGIVTTALVPYDMLPHTPHVEALALAAPPARC